MMIVPNIRLGGIMVALIALSATGCTVYPPRISGYPTGVAPATHQALQQQHATLMARFEELNHRTASLDSDNQRLQALLAQQQQQTAKMQASLQQSRDTVADLRDELTAERRQSSYTGYGSVPSAEVGYSTVGGLPLATIPGADVQQDGGDVRIRLDGGQLFASGQATIKNTPENDRLIEDVVATIRSQYPDCRLTVEGHTDSDPIRRSSWKSNEQLSLARAQAVSQALQKRGIPSARMSVAGLGAARPLAENNSKSGKARNRRVEIVIHAQSPR